MQDMLSDDSSKEQTNSNFVAQIRDTLKTLKIEPPYILMPHSASGVYSMKYIMDYPNEVESMIGIDSGVPTQAKYGYGMELSTGLYCLASFADFTGITRLYNNLKPDEHFEYMDAGGAYSEEELKIASTLRHRKLLSKAIFNEIRHFNDNCKELYDAKFPDNIPVLYILSDESCLKVKEEMAYKNSNITWEGLHNQFFSNPDIHKITVLKGKHYLHWNQSQAIADLSDQFISGYGKTNANKIKK